MTLEQLRNLKAGDIVLHATKKNADGTPMRAKVTSVKYWAKTGSIEVHVKHGLRDYAVFKDAETEQLVLPA